MELNGIPLHPLVVHAAVVFVPLAALAAVLYGVVPRTRAWLRWPLPVVAVIAALVTQLAAMSGEDLEHSRHLGGPLVEQHQMWAGRLQAATWVLAAVAVLGALPWLRRPGALRVGLLVVLVVLGVLDAYLVYQTGDAGARAVWQTGG